MAPALLVLEFHEGMTAVELPTELLGLGKRPGERSEERAQGAKNGDDDHVGSSLVDAGGLKPGVERNMVESEELRQGIGRMNAMHPVHI